MQGKKDWEDLSDQEQEQKLAAISKLLADNGITTVKAKAQ